MWTLQPEHEGHSLLKHHGSPLWHPSWLLDHLFDVLHGANPCIQAQVTKEQL